MTLHPSRNHNQRVATAYWIAAGVLCALNSPGPARGAEPEPEPITWRGDYAEAFEEARTANRLLWIQFTGPWCPNCTRMERDAFPDPDVIQHSRESFVPLKLRSDLYEQLALAFNLSGLPATVIVAPNRRILAVRQGYLGPDELDSLLSGARSSWRERDTSSKADVARKDKDKDKAKAQARPKKEADLALSGYCPVSLIADRRLVPGQAEYTVQHEGRLYRFASAVMSNLFRKDPARYIPVNHGDCPVARADHGAVRAGNPRWGVLYQGRLHLCATEEARRQFFKDPERYAMVDVAEQGFCAHCLGATGLLVRGDPKYEVSRDGRRFWFPDDSHRRAFLASAETRTGTASR
jgi:YHS domain-containing protein